MKKLLLFCFTLSKNTFYRGGLGILSLLLFPLFGYSQAPTVDITFCIDFTCEADAPGFAAPGILVEGGGVVTLDINQGDNVFCTTQTLNVGSEFLYRGRYAGAAGFVGLEDLTGEPCANAQGIRSYTVPSAAETVIDAWNSCDAQPDCGDAVDITICGNFTCVANAAGFAAPRILVDGAGVVNLNDNQGGNVYCTTLALTPGSEFRYTFNYSGAAGFVGMEDLSALEGDCASNGTGGLLRSYTVPTAAATDTRAWESCAATETCSTPGANVEFCVDVGCLPDVNTVSIFGQFNGFNPNANQLTDQGGGTWCTNLFLSPGPQEYKFLVNGVDEQLTPGSSCTVTCCGGAFTNRIINIVDGVDQNVSFGFASCDANCVPPPGAAIEFCVNVGCSGLDPNTVNIFGQFNGFNPTANPLGDQGNGIWCGTIFLTPGPQEYLFLADGVAESFPAGSSCTVTNFGFTNRIINIVDGQDQAVNFDWEECTFTPPGNGWSYADVTANNGSGSASFDPCDIGSGQVTIDYTATNGNPPLDNHGFTSTTLCGDGEISFRVVNVSSGAYIGPTMRETLSPASKQVSVFSNMTNILRWETRYATNGPLTVQSHYRPFPFWLKLIRQGNWVFGYYSYNGSNWSYVHAVNVSMDNCIEAGVSLWSYLPFVPSSGTVDNLSVVEYGNNSYNLSRPEISSNGVQAGEWELFPNPATSRVSVRWDSEVVPTQMNVYNQNGQIVRRQILDAGLNSLELQVDDLSSGVYMIEMKDEQRRLKTLPFVKQ